MEETLFSQTFCGKNVLQKAQKNAVIFTYLANFVQSVSKNVKKTLFSHTFCGRSSKKHKKRCFSPILQALYKVSQKTWKNHCFLTFFAGRRAKSSEEAVFRIFCELCTKCLEKREKTLFSHTFCRTSCKKFKKRCFIVIFANFVQSVSKTWKNSVFLHFLRDVVLKAQKTCFFCFSPILQALYKVSQKTWKKHFFLTLFAGRRAKSSEEAVFRIFCELCTKCLEKREKTLFSHTFCGTSCKNLKKRCFSHFMRTLYKVSRKTWKTTVFSHFLQDFVQKAQKTLLFRLFCELCTKCLENVKKLFSHTFCGTSCKKLKNRCFFAIFANFVKSVSKNVKETLFSPTFCGTSCKNLKKRCFSHFTRTLYKLSLKTWKNTVFSHFLQDFVQKAQKTLLFRLFCELCTKCLENVKKLFSHTFCGTSCKKLKNRCFFAIFANFVKSVSKNVKETLFSPTFCGTSCKNLKKRCFSHFTRTLY